MFKLTASPPPPAIMNYAGAKKKAIELLMPYIPSGVSKIVSPFCGGCSFELWLSSNGYEVVACDHDPYLINFWNTAKNNISGLAEEFAYYVDKPRLEVIHELKRNMLAEELSVKGAAARLALAKASFSSMCGYTNADSRKRVTENYLNRVANFKCPDNLSFKLVDWEDSLKIACDFLYLDPPYYKHGDVMYYYSRTRNIKFDHKKLCDTLKGVGAKFMLSYDGEDVIKKMYSWARIVKLEWLHTLKGVKPGDEILIMNY